jgi:hypothetical protein
MAFGYSFIAVGLSAAEGALSQLLPPAATFHLPLLVPDSVPPHSVLPYHYLS